MQLMFFVETIFINNYADNYLFNAKGFNCMDHTTLITAGGRVKIKLFSREGQIFPGGCILIFFPENVKYQNLLC